MIVDDHNDDGELAVVGVVCVVDISQVPQLTRGAGNLTRLIWTRITFLKEFCSS